MADGYINIPSMEAQATTDMAEVADGYINFPSTSVTCSAYQTLHAIVENAYPPAFSVHALTAESADFYLPPVLALGYALVEGKAAGIIELPSIRGNINDEFHDIPKGIIGLTANHASMKLPDLDLGGYVIVSPIASGYCSFKLTVKLRAITGVVGKFDKRLPRVKLFSKVDVLTQRICNGKTTLGAMELISSTDGTIIGNFMQDIPGVKSTSIGTINAGTFELLTWQGD